MATVPELMTTFGVAIIGGVVAPQVSMMKERRAARGHAAEQLCRVEQARWWPTEYDVYRSAVAAFEAAALVAGIKRNVVNHYIGVSRVAKFASHRAGPNNDDASYGGQIDDGLGAAMWAAAELVRDCLWHPFRSRVSSQRRLAGLLRDCGELRLQLVDRPDIRWELLQR